MLQSTGAYGTANYGYDGASQLTSESHNGAANYNFTYTYDGSGNRHTKTSSEGTDTYTYFANDLDRLHSVGW